MEYRVFAVLAGLLLALPVVVAAPLATGCDVAVDAALAEFATYDYNVPSHVARIHVNHIAVACADPALPPAPLIVAPDPGDLGRYVDVDTAKVKEKIKELRDAGGVPDDVYTCSGGSATILGWSNTVFVMNRRIHVLNEPASSYYTFVISGNSVLAADGHTRSEANNFEIKTVEGSTIAYWDWMNVPMIGTYSLSFRCVQALSLVTSVSLSLSGSPPLVSEDVLRVEAAGTTCLIPC